MSESKYGKFVDSFTKGGPIELPGGLNAGGLIKSSTNNDQYMRLDFDSAPILQGKVLADGSTRAHAAPTGNTGDVNLCTFPEGTLEYHVLGAGQTILGPILVATGLDISQDETNNEGIEYSGGFLAKNKLTYTVGTATTPTKAFYAKMLFYMADVSGNDECAFGFRKAEDYQTTLDGYDAMACLNNISGTINVETILDNGSNVTTSTTDTFGNGETHEFKVLVSAAGVVTYEIDGMPPSVLPTLAFSFSSAEVVIPFFYFLYDATSPGDIILKKFECGLQ